MCGVTNDSLCNMLKHLKEVNVPVLTLTRVTDPGLWSLIAPLVCYNAPLY